MASFTDIPELVKIMNNLFGERWGRRLGRATVILILAALMGAAVAAIMAGIGAVTSWAASNPTTSNILQNLLIMLIVGVGLIALAGGLGAFIGMILHVTLAIPMRQNIDSTLEQIELILARANQTGVQDADKLLTDVRLLKNQWNTSRTTRIANWIFRKKTIKQQK
jgi:hypothetical protein